MDHVIVKGIQDSFSERVGRLCANFSSEKKIYLNAFEPILCAYQDVSTNHAKSSDKVLIHELEPEFEFDEPIFRALLSETSNTFTEVQQIIINKAENKSMFQKYSMTYRSSLRACLESLQRHICQENSITTSYDQKKYEHFMTILYSIECIWHLCEKMFLSKTNDGLILPHLLEWVRFHFPMSEQNALELMQIGREADLNENYWIVIKNLVAKGQIEIARTLLRMNSATESPCFKEADRILSTIPVYSVYCGLSLQKFRSTWKLWTMNIETKIKSGFFSTLPELEEIISLVIGDPHMWKEFCKTSSCWYEYFPGFLLYTEPTCKEYELSQHVNIWLTQWLSSKGYGRTANLKHLDRVVLSVLENNLHQVLHDIQNIGDNKWMVTHLTDLLFHAGQLQHLSNDYTNVNDFRDSLIFDFGKDLMSRQSFSKFGMKYLEYCKDGPVARELLLSRVPFSKDIDALKLISAARLIKSSGVEHQICRIMTKKKLLDLRYGNALQWAIRSNDQAYIHMAVDCCLKHYTATGEMLCSDTLAAIGSRMLICPRLMFLIKYFDFHQSYNNRSFSQAAEILINLLDSNITPPYFWSSLLADAIPLLEFKEPIIPTKETFIILHHLNNDLIPFVEKKNNNNYNDDPIVMPGCTDDLLQLLRLSCARNLSRAFTIENTIGP